MAHQITGFYFIGAKWIIYSTLYEDGRYASMHNREGLTDAQARGRFITEHNEEVDYQIKIHRKKKTSKLILN